MDRTIDIAAGAGGARPAYSRPDAIEEASNRWLIHPLSDRVMAGALRVGVSANAVSLLGLACGLAAAVCYFFTPAPALVISGFIFMIAWHVLDGADGRIARATGTASAFGRVIDGICDHLVFGAVYVALVLHLMAAGAPASIWWLAVAAGLSHAVQAAGYEERRQKYQRRLSGTARDAVSDKLLKIKGRRSFLADLYDAAQKLVAGGDHGLDDKLAALRQSSHNRQLAALVVDRTVPMVRAWSLLNANNRTLLIFIFCLIGEPQLYFLFELTVLNLLLVVLIAAEWRFERKLAASIRPVGAG